MIQRGASLRKSAVLLDFLSCVDDVAGIHLPVGGGERGKAAGAGKASSYS
jgi:hypothetical protein